MPLTGRYFAVKSNASGQLMAFTPKYQITPDMARDLMRIEASRTAVEGLPVTPRMLAKLRHTARINATHYSTVIEGNMLDAYMVERAIERGRPLSPREREEREVLGYYAALRAVEDIAAKRETITESIIKKLHALTMGGGKTRVKPSPYRDGQNAIYDSITRRMVYLPPQDEDVPPLMSDLVAWLETEQVVPAPIVAGLAHYQFATIHPYLDGNGRTARLLTTLVLHLKGYDLKGLYSLEEYYVEDLAGYYEALALGPHHNYCMGRVETDITPWLTYFCKGMAVSFERVQAQARAAATRGESDRAKVLRSLTPRQRKVLQLFTRNEHITATQVGKSLGLQPRTARGLCKEWSEEAFLVIADPSKKNRQYALADSWQDLVE
jgi:Fic family protein